VLSFFIFTIDRLMRFSLSLPSALTARLMVSIVGPGSRAIELIANAKTVVQFRYLRYSAQKSHQTIGPIPLR
jgi:hypothetical protein